MSSFCLKIDRTGIPHEVIQLAPHELPALGPHDVRIRLRYAPVNPADLNFIEGTYGRAAHPPCIPGHEASGTVEAIGSSVQSLAVGDAVIPLIGAGCWSQQMVAEEQFFARLPAGLDPVQTAMLRINPVTAWLLLREFADLSEGDWVAQNAGNSAVGQAIVQIAAQRGLRTLSFVRREEAIEPLRQLGATAVFLDDAAGLAAAKEHLGDAHLQLGLNAVGGDSAIRLMDLLSPGATMVTYGAMSRRSLKVPNRFLIFKNLQLKGLWVSRWLEHAGPGALYEVLEPLTEMLMNQQLRLPVEKIYPMSEAAEALRHAAESGREGKILLDLA
ncbi:MAG: 2-enoyl thioester reductase domain-containing protein [Verrucomicrobiales bacterium]|nr:2-enoyl thioester reductase domain-containing protein [Verrucomicrobiales bacterium]